MHLPTEVQKACESLLAVAFTWACHSKAGSCIMCCPLTRQPSPSPCTVCIVCNPLAIALKQTCDAGSTENQEAADKEPPRILNPRYLADSLKQRCNAGSTEDQEAADPAEFQQGTTREEAERKEDQQAAAIASLSEAAKPYARPILQVDRVAGSISIGGLAAGSRLTHFSYVMTMSGLSTLLVLLMHDMLTMFARLPFLGWVHTLPTKFNTRCPPLQIPKTQMRSNTTLTPDLIDS